MGGSRAVVLALLAVVGLRAMLPLGVEIALERMLSGALASRVEIDDVDLDFQEAEVVIENARLRAAETGAELARAGRLALDADWGALVRGRLEAERATLDGVRLSIAYDAEGRTNWAAVLGAIAEEPAAEEKGDGATFRMEVRRAEVGEVLLGLMGDSIEEPPRLRIAVAAFALDDLEVARSDPAGPLRFGLGSAETTPAEAPQGAPAATAGIDMRVDRLSLRQARVRSRAPELTDAHSVTPIVLEERNQPRIGFERLFLEGSGAAAEPLRLEGSSVGSRADVELRATRVALVPWNPVIESYSDYSVSRGKLSLHSRFRLEGDEYEAPSQVTLHNLSATARGGAFEKTFGMPLSTAIRLLKDPAGNIRLDVPVRGNLTADGGIDLAPAVADALRASIQNALANTGALPVDATGSLLRRMGEVAFLGLGEAAFDAGSHELEVDARLALDAAAGMAKQKSGSRVQLVTEVVSDDMKALGLEAPGEGVFGPALEVGRALVGGGRKVEGDTHARLAELSELRFDAIETYLRQQGFDSSRIVRKPWDGKVRDGLPRVLLRLETRAE